MNNIKNRISDLIAAIGDGATNGMVTDAIMKEIKSVFSDGRAALDHFGSDHRDELSKWEQAPEDLADRDCKPSSVADIHLRDAAVGSPADEPVPLGNLHPQSLQVAAGLKSTQAMRDRIRELMTDPIDDYDRAVAIVLDDLESIVCTASPQKPAGCDPCSYPDCCCWKSSAPASPYLKDENSNEVISEMTSKHLPAPPQEVPQRDTMLAVVASLAAAISLLERTTRAKKAAPSDKMFDQMLADYRKALANARDALALSRPHHSTGEAK